MDTKHEFIHKRMDECKDKIRSSRLTMAIGIILCSVLTLMSFSAASLLIPKFVEISLPVGLFGFMFPIYGLYHTVSQHNVVEKEKKKLKHLEKVEQEGIPKGKSLDQKRVYKIHELEERQNKEMSHLLFDEVLGGLSAAGWIVGTLTSLVNPIGISVTILSLIGALIAAVKGGFDENEIAKLQARIDNLQEDLVLEPVFGYPVKSSSRKTSKEKEKMIEVVYSKDISDYVERIAQKEVSETPKQKIKK